MARTRVTERRSPGMQTAPRPQRYTPEPEELEVRPSAGGYLIEEAGINGSSFHQSSNATVDTAFPKFSNLPVEIQDLIWSFAVLLLPQVSPRILRVAPDPDNWYTQAERSEKYGRLCSSRMEFSKAVEHPALRILPGPSASVPSLLHACQRSRTAALKDYVLWQTADFKRYLETREGEEVFVNKKSDVLYFMGDHYWLFEVMESTMEEAMNSRDPNARKRYFNFVGPAQQTYIHQLSGVQHFAMTVDHWTHLTRPWSDMHWLQLLPDLRDITVVICPRDMSNFPYVTRLETPSKLVPISPGTVRADTEKVLKLYAHNSLDLFHSLDPTRELPEFHVRTLYTSDEDNESSDFDRLLLEEILMYLHDWYDEIFESHGLKELLLSTRHR